MNPTVDPISVGVVQSSPIVGSPSSNADRLLQLIESIGHCDLVLAPELAISGYDIEDLQKRSPPPADRLDGPTLARFSELANDLQVVVAIGIIEAGSSGEFYDSLAILAPQARTRTYRKTHLFPPERQVFDPGDRLEIVDTAAAVLGPMICFEHAFPDVATTLASAGAQILLIPSAVPFGYEYLLRLRTRARAQDNQVFVLAANQATSSFCGQSMIVNPRGEVIETAPNGECTIEAVIDLTEISAERAREPSLSLRRPELYDSDTVRGSS